MLVNRPLHPRRLKLLFLLLLDLLSIMIVNLEVFYSVDYVLTAELVNLKYLRKLKCL